MAKVYTVPLTNAAQTLSISLGGTTYSLRVLWNKYMGTYCMDVATSTGTPILNSVPLVTGANLLEQYGYLGLANNGALLVQSDSNPLTPPTYESLGQTSQLYYVAP
jgi:hypothetical protein